MGFTLPRFQRHGKDIPPGVGGVNQIETGQRWVLRCPVFCFRCREKDTPPVLGGLNELRRGGGGFHTAPFSTSREGYPPSVGGVKQIETGQRWVLRCPVFRFRCREKDTPPVLGGLNKLRRGGGGFHTAPFSTSQEGYPPGVGGVKRAETGWWWVSHRPVFDATRTSRIKG